MNFFLTTLVFWTLAFGNYLLSRNAGGEAFEAFSAFAIGLFCLGLVVQVVGIFQNMVLREAQRRTLRDIATIRKKIEITKKSLEEYKAEFSTSLTKHYPDYEKEMFKTMSPSDAQGLTAYLAKYPELQFNGVLQKYTDGVASFLKEINRYQDKIEDEISDVELRQSSGWYYCKFSLPLGWKS